MRNYLAVVIIAVAALAAFLVFGLPALINPGSQTRTIQRYANQYRLDPLLVSSVPAFIFLEASLALLGLGDPVLPTWGKIINDAETNGALYKGYYYWIMEPAVLLMATGLGFAMLGFALDRIFNPRLRDM